jgi:c-di-GMP-binding flagellar brake protein YcgR
MDVGTKLEIQFKGGGTQLTITSELTGVEDDKYLMIKWPTVDPKVDASNLICKGNTVFVKYLREGVEFGFQSHILEVISNPAKLIFIKYPENTEVNVLREHRRVDCYLPASVSIADNKIKGAITDISRMGVLFVAEIPADDNTINQLETSNEIGLTFQLPGMQRELTIAVKLRSITKGKDKVLMGIEYGKMDVEIRIKLFDFLSTTGA